MNSIAKAILPGGPATDWLVVSCLLLIQTSGCSGGVHRRDAGQPDRELDGSVAEPGTDFDALVEQDDRDEDGLADTSDNCPDDYNPQQEDRDNDGIGDKCDSCIPIPNHDQKDSDHDGEGDVCEDAILQGGDKDGDGVPNDGRSE